MTEGNSDGTRSDGTPGQGTFDGMEEDWQRELVEIADKVIANRQTSEGLGEENSAHLEAMLGVMKANNVPSFVRNGQSFTRREIERVETRKAPTRA